jgi:lipopolysaccharide export system permease protein
MLTTIAEGLKSIGSRILFIIGEIAHGSFEWINTHPKFLDYLFYATIVFFIIYLLMMKRLDKYIFSELDRYFIGVILAFVVLMIGNTVYGFAEHIFNKKIPIAIVTRILLFRTPAMFVLGLPLATLFAVVLSMGRFARDSEIIAMRTSGISRMRIYLPVLIFAFLVSIMTLFINERIVPWANHESQKDVLLFIHSNIAENAKANVFFRLPGDMVIHASDYNEATGSLSDLVLLDIQGHGFLKIMKVDEGTMTREPDYERVLSGENGETTEVLTGAQHDWLNLHNGVSFEFSASADLEETGTFRYVRKDISRQYRKLLGEQLTPQEMNSGELANLIDQLSDQMSDMNKRPSALETDFWFKFSIPAASFILAVVGLLFAVVSPRKEMFLGIIYAIVMLLIYWVIMTIARQHGRFGTMMPFLAAWLANLVFVFTGIPLLLFIKK